MHHVKLLDCTLRDGAYLVEKNIGAVAIRGITEGLVSAGIDIIEIGFLQDEGFGEGKTIYKNACEAEQYIPDDKKESFFAVLADYSRYSVDNLEAYTGKSFDTVRACFFKKERKDVLRFCREIKKKGYRLFVQPVDIMGYSDRELLELIEDVNLIEPYCFSIVDTFGSMYIDDLLRVYSIVHHNLISECKIGFHSHNNLQMSNALSQEFIKTSYGQREVVIDATVSGMGRGAGNTPTELIAQYLVTKMGYNYDMDMILDVIDQYMPNIQRKCTWGYSTPYFIAGSYGAHVNNIAFLKQKNSINSRDIRFILNSLRSEERKRYDYDLLERIYTDYMNSDIDDDKDMEALCDIFKGRNVVVIAPGASAGNAQLINEYIQRNNAVTVFINYLFPNIECDFLYLNNVKRYQTIKNSTKYKKTKKIFTSNIVYEKDEGYVIRFSRLIKCGWEHMDNSAIMLLRLLDNFPVRSIGIAGLDGYETGCENYISEDMEHVLDMSAQKINL